MFVELLSAILPAELIESIGTVFVALFALGLIVSSIVQLLKERGKIGDGQAGIWNARIGYALVVMTFLITQVFGLGQSVLDDATEFVTALMGVLTGGFAVTMAGKLIYLAARFAGMFRSFDEVHGLNSPGVRVMQALADLAGDAVGDRAAG